MPQTEYFTWEFIVAEPGKERKVFAFPTLSYKNSKQNIGSSTCKYCKQGCLHSASFIFLGKVGHYYNRNNDNNNKK